MYDEYKVHGECMVHGGCIVNACKLRGACMVDACKVYGIELWRSCHRGVCNQGKLRFRFYGSGPSVWSMRSTPGMRGRMRIAIWHPCWKGLFVGWHVSHACGGLATALRCAACKYTAWGHRMGRTPQHGTQCDVHMAWCTVCGTCGVAHGVRLVAQHGLTYGAAHGVCVVAQHVRMV
eukprot:364079-Chlamydomonas_euryale.AAC.5